MLFALVAVLLIIFCYNYFQSSQKKEPDLQCYQGQIGATVIIPTGKFTMGSTKYYPEEDPKIEVTVDEFNIDIHEVTNSQFRHFIEATGYITSAERTTELGFKTNGAAVFSKTGWSFVTDANWRNPEGSNSTINDRDHYPVVQVSLEDAQAYAKWVGRKLPSEAQWEYAARNGLTKSEYERGDSLTSNGKYVANTWQGVFPIINTAADGYINHAPIGCFEANSYGLFDLIGNVWEWTSDPYYPRHQLNGGRNISANGDDIGSGPNQKGIPVGVIKGGSFLCSKDYCQRYRPSARHAQDIKLGTNHIGFRTVGY